MSDDSLWSDYDQFLWDSEEDYPLTGEAYKEALTDETLDALDFMALLLKDLEK